KKGYCNVIITLTDEGFGKILCDSTFSYTHYTSNPNSLLGFPFYRKVDNIPLTKKLKRIKLGWHSKYGTLLYGNDKVIDDINMVMKI
ncbi:unnamed protein product, partial [marine sediment metagenome]